MPTLTITQEDLDLTESVSTTIEEVAKDYIRVKGRAEHIKIDPAHIKTLNLKAGDLIKIEPVKQLFSITVYAEKVLADSGTANSKIGGSPMPGEVLSNELNR